MREVDTEDGSTGPDAGAFPRIIGFRTLHDTSFIDTVGFVQEEGRLRIVLAKELRDAAGGLVREVVDALLEEHGLRHDDIAHWILHPGGRKIIDAVRPALGLSEDQVRHSKFVLRNFGNMSSPTVLFVLDRTVRDPALPDRPKAGDLGVMIAMGPGLAVEGALVRW
jgi:predicted naringenin-chalcone synthase